MPVRNAKAIWNGSIGKGSGIMAFGSGAYEGTYSVPSRFEDGDGTNPEELIAAAHAGCYSMALSSSLTGAGHPPDHIETEANVSIEKVDDAWTITRIDINTQASVPDIDEVEFMQKAQEAKENCPVSRALTGPEIFLEAKLL